MDLNVMYHKLAGEDQSRVLTMAQQLNAGLLSSYSTLQQLVVYIDDLGAEYVSLTYCGGFFTRRYVLKFTCTVAQARMAIRAIISII